MSNDSRTAPRAIVYCIIPADLSAKLHEPLRQHFAEDPSIVVVVETRGRKRRDGLERRTGQGEPPAKERRVIRARAGRRVADRRATAVVVDLPVELPRRARAQADRLVFVERLEPPTDQLEDADSARLVARFQAGDSDAFADLYLRYFDRVYRSRSWRSVTPTALRTSPSRSSPRSSRRYRSTNGALSRSGRGCSPSFGTRPSRAYA